MRVLTYRKPDTTSATSVLCKRHLLRRLDELHKMNALHGISFSLSLDSSDRCEECATVSAAAQGGVR